MSKRYKKESDDPLADAEEALMKSSSKAFVEAVERKRRPQWYRLVGKTTFTESRNLAQLIPCERLFLKFEGNNPTGTQKDRIALAIAEEARKFSFDAITTATCGNYGAALAYAAHTFKIPEIHIFIPRSFHVPKSRLRIMEQYKAQIHFTEGTYEDAVYESTSIARDHNWYNANPGMNGTSEVSVDAYAEIANELLRSLHKAPDYIFCPVGNGTTLAGIHRGFKKLYNTKKITHLPRMVACSTRRGNSIIKSFKSRNKDINDLLPTEIRETKVNEPLTNWHAFDGQEALDALYESNGFAEYASDLKMLEFARLLKQEEGLSVHPASACTLAVLSTMTKNRMMLKGTYVVILTGRYS